MTCKDCKCNKTPKPVIVVYVDSAIEQHSISQMIKDIKDKPLSEDYHLLFVPASDVERAVKVEALYFDGTTEDINSLQEKLLNQINQQI